MRAQRRGLVGLVVIGVGLVLVALNIRPSLEPVVFTLTDHHGVHLTDVVGTFYTLVLEFKIPSIGDLEANMSKVMGNKEWQANYQKITALVDSGYREIFTIVE